MTLQTTSRGRRTDARVATSLSVLALVIAALLGAALLVPASAAAAPEPPPRAGLERHMQRVVAAGAPGIVALVDDVSERRGAVDDAVRPWTAARGVADLRTQRPLRASDRFRIGSVTKSFVATVALQLVDDGRLSLADTVEARLPGVLPYGAGVTLRQLLDHTSGVPEYAIIARERLYRGQRFRSSTPRALVALVAGEPQQFPAGTELAYSNTNYVLAGMMIEQATGRRLGREIRRRILGPLRLRDTSFPLVAPSIAGRHAHGYSLPHDDEGNPVRGKLLDLTTYNPSSVWAAGNMVSDLDDVARFYRALLGGRLLSRAALEEMKGRGRPWMAGQRYGLGLHVIRTPCGPVFGHTGGVPGFATFVFSNEDGTRQAGLMMNAENAPAAAAGRFELASQRASRAALAGTGRCRAAAE